MVAPVGMADFVCDSLYPALSTRLFALDLNPALEARLHAYRAKRLLEVNALLNLFVTLQNQPGEEQERQLREFAQTQTPALVGLEADAERLREEVIADGFSNRIDWNANRRWKVGAVGTGADVGELEAEFQVVRATAFYQKGLIPQQRGLLREARDRTASRSEKARGLPAVRSESDAMFFSPETSRFRLPAGLSLAAREKIGTYNGQKASLKNQLRETIIAQDKAPPAVRAAAFEALADEQWPHFAALEELARTSDGCLSPASSPRPRPRRHGFPPGCWSRSAPTTRIVIRTLARCGQRIESAEALVPRPDYSASSDERVQRQREFAEKRAEARQQATAAFQTEQAPRFAALYERYNNVIRQTLASWLRSKPIGRQVVLSTPIRCFASTPASMEEFDTFGRAEVIYANYRIAMLQPASPRAAPLAVRLRPHMDSRKPFRTEN
jgi:hypothetical protein